MSRASDRARSVYSGEDQFVFRDAEKKIVATVGWAKNDDGAIVPMLDIRKGLHDAALAVRLGSWLVDLFGETP